MREYSNLTEPFYGVPFDPKQCKDCAYKRPHKDYKVDTCLKYKISKPDAVMENTGKCKEYKKEYPSFPRIKKYSMFAKLQVK